jgi:hypothetical protein
MTDTQEAYKATAPIWLLLLGVIIEVGTLPVTRAMLAALLP